jgi:hypothetical protein
MLDTLEEIDNLHLHPDLVEGSNDPMYNSDAASKFTSESIEVVNNGAELSTTSVDSLNNSRITLAEDSINESVNSLNNSMLSLEYNSVSDSLDANDDRLHEARQKARSPSGYPTRNLGGVSGYRSDHVSPSPTRKTRAEPMFPLLPAGKKMTLDEFLIHCNIEVNDPMCQILIKGHDVKHWSFFRGKSDEQLMRIGFTRGLATHLSNGARELEHIMVQKDFS